MPRIPHSYQALCSKFRATASRLRAARKWNPECCFGSSAEGLLTARKLHVSRQSYLGELEAFLSV